MLKWSHLLSLVVFAFPVAVVISSTMAPILMIIYQAITGQKIERRISFVSELNLIFFLLFFSKC